MDFLNKIITHKRLEIEERRTMYPVQLLEKSGLFHQKMASLEAHLRLPGASGIIAEFKRRSPSKGWINAAANVETVTTGYVKAGATALSVLTDIEFFGGQNDDLAAARRLNDCPILRKDFTIDEYQIIEAKSLGASAVLLIAACLSEKQVQHFAKLARSLDLDVLLEIHEASELGHYCEDVNLIGVNNRNLSDFSVDIQRSHDMLPLMPTGIVRIAESGLSDPASVVELRAAGFDGFLMGEHFMKHDRPEHACRNFIKNIRP